MDPVELLWPMTLDGSGGFAFTSDPAVRLRKHVLSVLSTEMGERVMRPTFGAGVSRFIFESLDEPEVELLRESVTAALSTLVSEVRVVDVNVEAELATSQFLVSVRYQLANGTEGTAEMTVGDRA